jgi:hypothetical protein
LLSVRTLRLIPIVPQSVGFLPTLFPEKGFDHLPIQVYAESSTEMMRSSYQRALGR